MAKRTDKQTASVIPENISMNLPTTSERERLAEMHRREGYDVRCENGIIMFYGDISFDKVKTMLKADGYNASYGVTRAKLKS